MIEAAYGGRILVIEPAQRLSISRKFTTGSSASTHEAHSSKQHDAHACIAATHQSDGDRRCGAAWRSQAVTAKRPRRRRRLLRGGGAGARKSAQYQLA